MSQRFELTILGSGSASPTSKRNPSSQVLNIGDKLYLIDCGEGTQVALRKNKIKFQRIEHIFISHLHGDHYLGMQGLLSTFSLLGRSKDLHIYSPKGLKEICELQFKISRSYPTFFIHFHEVKTSEKSSILETDQLNVYAFPLKHRIETYGFLFKEKKKPLHINGSVAKAYNIPHYAFDKLKQGEDFVDPETNERIANKELTLAAGKSYSYAYCSDTAFLPGLSEIVKNVDLLYHETTFMEKDVKLAKKTHHSTCKEAAMIAKEANAGKLLMGHYSARYPDLDLMKEECQSIFPESYLSQDGDVIKV